LRREARVAISPQIEEIFDKRTLKMFKKNLAVLTIFLFFVGAVDAAWPGKKKKENSSKFLSAITAIEAHSLWPDSFGYIQWAGTKPATEFSRYETESVVVGICLYGNYLQYGMHPKSFDGVRKSNLYLRLSNSLGFEWQCSQNWWRDPSGREFGSRLSVTADYRFDKQGGRLVSELGIGILGSNFILGPARDRGRGACPPAPIKGDVRIIIKNTLSVDGGSKTQAGLGFWLNLGWFPVCFEIQYVNFGTEQFLKAGWRY